MELEEIKRDPPMKNEQPNDEIRELIPNITVIDSEPTSLTRKKLSEKEAKEQKVEKLELPNDVPLLEKVDSKPEDLKDETEKDISKSMDHRMRYLFK